MPCFVCPCLERRLEGVELFWLLCSRTCLAVLTPARRFFLRPKSCSSFLYDSSSSSPQLEKIKEAALAALTLQYCLTCDIVLHGRSVMQKSFNLTVTTNQSQSDTKPSTSITAKDGFIIPRKTFLPPVIRRGIIKSSRRPLISPALKSAFSTSRLGSDSDEARLQPITLMDVRKDVVDVSAIPDESEDGFILTEVVVGVLRWR